MDGLGVVGLEIDSSSETCWELLRICRGGGGDGGRDWWIVSEKPDGKVGRRSTKSDGLDMADGTLIRSTHAPMLQTK